MVENRGLSLYLCKLIIEAHNGLIVARNKTNGAYVKIEFPVVAK